MRRIFITGTDTDCGKTYITCQLLKYFQQETMNVYGVKPIVTGFDSDSPDRLSDPLQINAYNPHQNYTVTPWRFKMPVSPHIAAAQENKHIFADDLVSFCRNTEFDSLDFLLIEGAGGLMVPLNDKETWIDFIQKLACSVILVVGLKLGCLNHALLTVEVFKRFELPVLGYIINCVDPDMAAMDDNIKTLQARLRLPYLGIVPYKGELIPSELFRMIVPS